jgi:hypothetical protein
MLLQFKDPLKLKTKRVRDIIFDAFVPLHFVASYLLCGERSRKNVAPIQISLGSKDNEGVRVIILGA